MEILNKNRNYFNQIYFLLTRFVINHRLVQSIIFFNMEILNKDRSQDVHSGRRNGAFYGRKRRFTALIFTLFHRNPSVRITTAVSGRFLPVYSRLRAVFLGLGYYFNRIYLLSPHSFSIINHRLVQSIIFFIQKILKKQRSKSIPSTVFLSFVFHQHQ
jgi:hypothetical protein